MNKDLSQSKLNIMLASSIKSYICESWNSCLLSLCINSFKDFQSKKNLGNNAIYEHYTVLRICIILLIVYYVHMQVFNGIHSLILNSVIIKLHNFLVMHLSGLIISVLQKQALLG